MPSTDPKKRRQHARTYYHRHREEVLVKAAEYRDANRVELARRQRAYYEIHKDEILARRRALKNKEIA